MKVKPAEDNQKIPFAIFCAIVAAFFFTLNDVGIKFLSGDYALHQIVLLRALFAMPITLLVLMPLEGGWYNLKTKRLGIHLARGLCVVMANMMFLLSLAALPLADATAVFFIAPLFITLFSILFLGERVGPLRWLAVFLGFAGVLVMLKPGSDGMLLAVLFPVVGAACYAMLHIFTRKIRMSESASTMTFYIQLVFVGVALFMGLIFGDGRYGHSGDPSIDFLLRAWV